MTMELREEVARELYRAERTAIKFTKATDVYRAMADAALSVIQSRAKGQPGVDPRMIEALRSGQQADRDGVMVMVSRQACEEAADLLEAQRGGTVQPGVDGLFAAIKHGDDKHQAWLKQAITDYFAGRPVVREPQPRSTPSNPGGWRAMESAPKGYPSLENPSEWFLARPAKRSEGPKGKPPACVIRRCFGHGFGPWECTGDAYYRADFFDAWMPLPPSSDIAESGT